jgi:hypothetical protein
MAERFAYRMAGLRIPQPRRAVLGSGEQLPSVRAELNSADQSAVAERCNDGLSGGRIPNLDRIASRSASRDPSGLNVTESLLCNESGCTSGGTSIVPVCTDQMRTVLSLEAVANLEAQIEVVRSTSANNVNGIDPLNNLVISDPPTQGEVGTLMDRLNELINGLHRQWQGGSGGHGRLK